MVTKVTNENKGLYQVLFKQASEVMDGAIISSLDEYFACFKTLAEADQIYTILPMDEPTFDIDANSREIIVPPEFKRNGISVQGDQIAEIIYFTIDRYFDTTDLYDDDIHIVIQWETAINGKTSDKGISLAILKDVVRFKDEGKMLIGWAINNKITAQPGTVKFAVRFYRIQDNELTFSLSTLTQTAIINPGLDYSLDTTNNIFLGVETCHEDAQIVKNRFKDSVYNEGADAASAPYFIKDLAPENVPQTEDGIYLVDLNAENTYGFTVKASSNDGGFISYEWYHTPIGGTPNSITGEFVYLPTTDTEFNNSKVYYEKKTVNGNEGYVPYAHSFGAEWPDIVLYEQLSGYNATSTGDYYVTAKNRKGVMSATLNSQIVRVPGPAALAIQFPEGQENTILDENGNATLSITGNTDQIGDTVSYIWKVEGNEELSKRENQDKNVVNTFSIETVPEDERAKFDKKVMVDVYASRNKTNTPVESKVFRITDEAHEVDINIVGTNFDLRKDLKISVEVDISNVLCDYLEYQWYRVVRTDDVDPVDSDYGNDPSNDVPLDSDLHEPGDEDLEDLAHGVKGRIDYVDIKNNKVIISTHVYNAKNYYCRVINHVNGTEKAKDSAEIRVSSVS